MINFNRFIEYTNLKTTITGRDVDQLVRDALGLGVLGICIPPFWVKRAAREIGASDLQLVTVIGFPLGYQMTETKMEEARLALRDGANELDVVMNISAFKDGMPWPKIELAKLSKLTHESEAMLKVIIEVGYLSDEEIVKAARLCADSGVDFVKTSTGTVDKGGAARHHIELLRQVLPSSVGIKASGGIRSKEQVIELVEAGADRIGTSHVRSILSE